MFGQTGNPSFGFSAAQNNPFGQSTFGKTISTTNFGSTTTPVFGSNSSLFTSKPTNSTGSLFGNTTTTPTFGASTATQSFGGFGNTSTNTPLFGAQQNAATNLFGTNNSATAFGQTNKPTSFGFAQSTSNSLFGQTQPQVTQSAFGQSTSGNTTLFGTSAGFGGTNTVSGTVVKFSPVTGTDTMIKNGVTQTISTRHHCITCMKEYESKSLEELRLEDYAAGRKGVNQGQPSTLFGTGNQNSPFSSVSSSSNTASSGFGLAGGFGNASQAGNSSLFSKSITGFGTPATTSSAFAFNSAPSTNLFNAQSKPFGATTSTPLFATSNTSSSAGSAFGNVTTPNTGFGTGFSCGPSNQSIGLFNQNKPAFNIPPSTSSSNFGFGQSTTTNASNLFGTKPIATGFGTPFIGTSSSTFQTANSGFGSAPNSNSTLFNNTFKPAGPTAGFTFGNTSGVPSTSLGSSGTSLFNTANKTNIFANTGSTTNFNNSGAFGNVSSFGNNNTAGTNFSTNLFGQSSYISSNQNCTGSVPVHQQILALVSAPFGDSPLLKNLLPASGKSEQFLKPSNSVSKALNNSHFKIQTGYNSPKIKAKVISSAPLSKKSLFDGLEEEDPLLEAFQPRPNAKRLVLRPKINSTNESTDKILKNDKLATASDESVFQSTNKENNIQENNKPSNFRRSSNSWLKSTFPRKSKAFEEHCSDQLSEFPAGLEVPIADEFENTVAELRSQTNTEVQPSHNKLSKENAKADTSLDKSYTDSNLHESKSSNEDIDEMYNIQKADKVLNKANVKLQRHGYYTIPSIDTLDQFVIDKTCIVPNFTIGRKGYGNVYFPESFDIYGLNLDEIVHFRHKEVIIYPDDSIKPPVGEGLNRKAQVTLDRVWPHDKAFHEPITDPERLLEMDYEGKLRRVSAKHDTRFLEYRPETGSWVFKVDHFSKYGLSDSDDDDSALNSNQEAKKNKSIRTLKIFKNSSELHCIKDLDSSEVLMSNFSGKQKLCPYNAATQSLEILDPDEFENQCMNSPTSVNARLKGTESHTLQLMKATFFEITDDIIPTMENSTMDSEIQQNQKTYNCSAFNTHFQENKKQSSVASTWTYENDFHLNEQKNTSKNFVIHVENRKNLSCVKTRATGTMPIIRPKIAILKLKTGAVVSNHSLINRNCYKYIADIGIRIGKVFRCSWGPKLSLLSLSTHHLNGEIHAQNTEEQMSPCSNNEISSLNIVRRFRLIGGNSLDNNQAQRFKASIEGHLNIQLKYSKIEDQQGCPIASVISDPSGILSLNAHKIYSTKIADNFKTDTLLSYFCDVWKLCESLWGKVENYDRDSHETTMYRKEALSDWLKNTSLETVRNEIATMDVNDQIIFSLLSANNLEEACTRALKVGDHCLALLISQMGGIVSTSELIKQQIELWQNTDVDSNLSVYRLKLFMLIAGVPVVSKKNSTINVCENIDWKRSLALHLWYLSPPTSSIADAIDLYEASFLKTSLGKSVYSPNPQPDYFKNEFFAERSNGKPMLDLCYHLLKLYCTGNYPMETIFNPQTYTYDPLDYRLSWFLHQVLCSLGYSHTSNHVSELIHANFAAQLESFGLWHWAIFIILHIKDSFKRRTAVFDLLLKYVDLDSTSDYEEREAFLISDLKIPSKWINFAKAIKSCTMKRYDEAAWFFIRAEKWNEAHEIIIEHLTTEAIINDNYGYLKELLQTLIPTTCYNTISGWAYQGQLIWDYIIIATEIKRLLMSQDTSDIGYQLELLQPQLVSLCTKITLFPRPTTKHRLCQAEMAKRTLQLARSLLMLQSVDANTRNFLVQLISQLPLPEDYAQQELRPIINVYVSDMD